MSLIQDIIDNKLFVGHPKNQSNPKTRASWAGVYNGQVMFDPAIIEEQLQTAKKIIKNALDKKKTVLILGDKEIYKEEVATAAEKRGVFYMNHKIPAGVLSNSETLMGMIKTLTTLSSFVSSPSFFDLTKKEQSMKKRLLKKIELVYKGVKNLKSRPDLVVIIDGQMMQKFVHEAEKLRVPAIVCTSSNLDKWTDTHLVTCNINSSKSVEYVLNYILS
ncbi:MAG: hypothetical protein RL023_869 [Candidatus Parcubacteria bacterium]